MRKKNTKDKNDDGLDNDKNDMAHIQNNFKLISSLSCSSQHDISRSQNTVRSTGTTNTVASPPRITEEMKKIICWNRDEATANGMRKHLEFMDFSQLGGTLINNANESIYDKNTKPKRK